MLYKLYKQKGGIKINTTIIIYYVLTIINFLIVVAFLYFKKNKFIFILIIIKKFSLKMFIETNFIIGIFLLCYFTISAFFPFLNWGWINLLNKESGGNVLITPIIKITMVLGNIGIVILIVFFITLILTFPLAAIIEEKEFREKQYEWKKIIPKSIKFGLSHLTMGIPISAAISLIIPGLFFSYKYINTYKKLINQKHSNAQANKEAIIISTTYHTMYNFVLIIIILIYIIFHIKLK